MALFNESLTARYQELITKLHGTKGASPAPQITPEIGHVIVLENDRPEHLVLAHGFPWAIRIAVAANATHNGVAGIRNPANSGLIVVARFRGNNAAGPGLQQYELRSRLIAAIANSGNSVFTDTRRAQGGSFANSGAPIGISDNTSFTSGAAFSSQLIDVLTLTTQEGGRAFDYWFMVGPGYDLAANGSVVNQAIDVSMWGYAVPLEPQQVSP